MFISSSEI